MNVHIAPAGLEGPAEPRPIDATRRNQARASDPRRSAWVSANAGSGKTHVLKQRVIRLLLMDVDPSRILCLTYTKLAAAEMANRVFGELAEWATLPDDALVARIWELEGVHLASQPADVVEQARLRVEPRLPLARTLFARALETPGGLKIQTIHSFCEAILHQFPLEANVPARFRVVEDERRAELMREAREAMWIAARGGRDDRLTAAADAAMRYGSDAAVAEALDEVIARRELVAPFLRLCGDGDVADELRRRFDLAGHTAETLKERFWRTAPLAREDLEDWAERARAGKGKSDATFAETVASAWANDDDCEAFDLCAPLFVTQAGKARASDRILTKAVTDGDVDDLADQSEAIVQARGEIATLDVIEGSAALFALADDLMRRYAGAKREAGLLDFDDIIARTADLLEREGAGAWVHYKLDRGLHHVLVDEAQDTSPRQWRIVGRLVDEFFSGEGVYEDGALAETGLARTVFAVGDEKQSIFSFQGAQPAAFEEQRRRFAAIAPPDEIAGESDFHSVDLKMSFRSVQDVLDAVDAVFADPSNREGLDTGGDLKHDAARHAHRGHVEIWPRIAHGRVPEPDEWTRPVDVVGEGHGTVQLARRIAARVHDWIARGECLTVREGGRDVTRPVHAGDVLVLVRARDAFIPALTRELKLRGVAVAGTDRLALADHIAVQDLLALGRTVLMPEDDLSLAAILKSPFWRVSEDELYRLARPADDRPRQGTLYDRMRETAPHDAKVAHALAEIEALRERAGRVPVHEFYAHLLGPMGGRARVFARLGRQAEDVLDAFLQAALEHEETGPGGLQTFVEAMTASGAEVKREMEGHAREVRIMTVHAAKGLQAPIVFLVDKGSAPFNSGHAPKLLHDRRGTQDGGAFVWTPTTDRLTPPLQHLRARDEADALAEYRRLLYVGMTRAADRLVVCGYAGADKDGAVKQAASPDKETWHEMVSRVLLPRCDAVACDFGGGEGGTIHRFPQGAATSTARPDAPGEETARPRAPMPASLLSRLPAEPDVPRPLTPAGSLALVDGASLRGGLTQSLLADGSEGSGGPGGGGGGELARRRGTLAHRLLQALPDLGPDVGEDERRAVAMRFLRGTLRRTPEAELEALVDEVLAVMRDLDPAFGPRSRAEVSVRGLVTVDGEEVMLSGQIDRLVVGERVTVLDFKTGRDVPETLDAVPGDYVRQLAIYRALVRQIWDRPVTAMLVWTHAAGGPRPMVLSDDMLDAAIA